MSSFFQLTRQHNQLVTLLLQLITLLFQLLFLCR
ncbi:unknown [Bacteroides sp. CAG:875]|nr:unknown [Bacteroides sp. CAG:875]